MATRNFNVKNGLTAGNITLDATTNTTTTANLVVTGNANLTTAANVALGSNSNVKITGGSSGQYLQTDGAGNLSWQSVSGATSIANGTSNVRIPVANGNVVVSVNGAANIATFTSNAVFRGSYNLTGIISQSNTAPSNPQNGDQWYNTFNGILFEYLDDGTSSQWVDISSLPLPNIATVNASAVLNNVQSTGTYFPAFISSTANANYALSSNSAFSANFANGAMIATTFVGALSGAATTAGTVTTAAQPNITSVGTLTGLGVNGTITAVNITANTGVFAGSGANLTTLNASNISSGTLAQARLANSTLTLGNTTLTLGGTTTTVSGLTNVTSTQFTSNVATGTAPFVVSSTTQVANLNAATAGSATTAGTVTTAAQPNITSTGTLTGLTVSGTTILASTSGNVGIGATPDRKLYVLGPTGGTPSLSNADGEISIFASGTTQALVIGASNASPFGAWVQVKRGNNDGTSWPLLLNPVGGNVGIANTNPTHTLSVTGTLNVSGNANVGNIGATRGVFTNIAGEGGNISNIQGANVSGAVATATTAGTVTTAAQPNITSVGTLTSLGVTGNIAAGNLTTTGVLSVTGTGVSSIAGNLDMTSNTIINLATPTNANDAATKQYVDDVAQGLHTHDTCNAATNTTLASISGGTVTYNNGSSGVGATLTTTGSYTTIDGVTLTNGMRILVKDEANSAHNGIYDRTSATVLTRSTDFDTPAEMAGGDFTFITAGTLYDNTGWVMTEPVTTVGTSPVPWVQFSGAGTYTAGTGLTLTGSQFSVNASQTQITSVGTLTGLNSSGTITAPAFTANTGVFTGNGSGLSAIAGANVTGTVASATTAGTVTTAAQPNITSVGTLTGLGVNGTVTAVNFTANTGVFTGNGSGLSAIAGANVTGTVSSATSATTAGTVTTAAQPNITSVGTLTGLGVNGTVTAVNFTANTGVFAGSGANLTTLNASNISSGTLAQARLANASVTLGSTALTLGSTVTTVAGLSSVTSTTFVGSLSGAATTAGTVTTAAQPNITSVGTLTSLAVTGTTGVTVTDSAATASTAKILRAVNGTQDVFFAPRLGPGSYNNLVATDDIGLIFGNTSAQGNANITIAPWASANTGIRIQSVSNTATIFLNATTTNVSSALQVTNITTGANTTAGTVTGNWTLTAGSRWQATYADLAEKYAADATYEPGTVLLFGGEQEVTLSNAFDSTKVAGVVTTNPAYSMNAALEAEHIAEIALQGRVPCKVIGPIEKGDLMVSASNGHAIANNEARAGTIIGKALENFTGEVGIIEVAVGRF